MLKYAFKEVLDGIKRLYVPFEGTNTSVFIVKSDSGYFLIDCATTSNDVAEIIIPAIKAEGIALCKIKYILLTHRHGDHAGGIYELARQLPKAKICASTLAASRMTNITVIGLEDEQTLDGVIAACSLPGHTDDSMGYVHLTTKTLISGDCVQQYGIGKYGCGLESPSMYRSSLKRLLDDKTIENILPAHTYVPFGDEDFGREAYEAHIEGSLEYCELASEFISHCLADGITDASEIGRMFKETYSDMMPGNLVLPVWTIEAYIANK